MTSAERPTASAPPTPASAPPARSPSRCPAEHQHRIGVGRTVFRPSHPQCAAFLIGDVAILCGIGKFTQIGEMFIRRAQYLNGGELTAEPTVESRRIRPSSGPVRWIAANERLVHRQIFRPIACRRVGGEPYWPR